MNSRLADEKDIELVREMFLEYQKELGVDLCFQGFEEEVASLPGPYVEPRGAILIGRNDLTLGGCVAIKPLSDGICELKRLYVRPEMRGWGLGEALLEDAIKEAQRRGYRSMRLDTLARLESATRLYRKHGFSEIEPYYENPLAERVLYMERNLLQQSATNPRSYFNS